MFSDSTIGRHFFNIPRSWFLKTNEQKDKTKTKKTKEENWEGDIVITANQKFKHFAMLNENKKKKCYMAFDNTIDSNLPMVV